MGLMVKMCYLYRDHKFNFGRGRVCTCVSKLFVDICVGPTRYHQSHSGLWAQEWRDLYFPCRSQCPKYLGWSVSLTGLSAMNCK